MVLSTSAQQHTSGQVQKSGPEEKPPTLHVVSLCFFAVFGMVSYGHVYRVGSEPVHPPALVHALQIDCKEDSVSEASGVMNFQMTVLPPLFTTYVWLRTPMSSWPATLTLPSKCPATAPLVHAKTPTPAGWLT